MPRNATPPMAEATLIQASGLACRRGNRILWRGLDVGVGAGDAVYVTGANGIGKSSLLRIVARLLPPANGSIAGTASVGLIDERLALDPQLPLADALAFWAGIDGSGRAGVAAALDRVGLTPLAGVPVRILSTGQRKRAALARLLASDAGLWLLDEPANGLDGDAVTILTGLIAAHRAAGGGVVLASHQPLALGEYRALALADYVPTEQGEWA
jgi:heme exporter protein A